MVSLKKQQLLRGVLMGIATLTLLLLPHHVFAAGDWDGDGLSDDDEITRYHTDQHIPDTDGDGYSDGEEVASGYSPHEGNKTRLDHYDYDKDGLNDALELAFGTDLAKIDSDNDGASDGDEVKQGRDPVVAGAGSLKKQIKVSLTHQELGYYLGTVELGKIKVSTGKPKTPTPKGAFSISGKSPRAWSKPAKLWMPYWMAFVPSGRYGLHELPEWPNGKKEGLNHLGTAVSGGCVRMGAVDAKMIYDWAPIGTQVVIND